MSRQQKNRHLYIQQNKNETDLYDVSDINFVLRITSSDKSDKSVSLNLYPHPHRERVQLLPLEGVRGVEPSFWEGLGRLLQRIVSASTRVSTAIIARSATSLTIR